MFRASEGYLDLETRVLRDPAFGSHMTSFRAGAVLGIDWTHKFNALTRGRGFCVSEMLLEGNQFMSLAHIRGCKKVWFPSLFSMAGRVNNHQLSMHVYINI